MDGDAPVAGALAAGLVGEALGGFEDVDGAALLRERFGDGAGDWAAYFFFAVQEQDDFVVELAGFGEHLDGGECHGYAGFHIQGAGAVEALLSCRVGGDAAGHGFEGAEGPDGVEVAEEEDAAGGLARAETQLQDIAPGLLAVTLDSSAQGFRVAGGKVHAGIHGGFVVGGGFGEDQLSGEVEELGLLAAGSG